MSAAAHQPGTPEDVCDSETLPSPRDGSPLVSPSNALAAEGFGLHHASELSRAIQEKNENMKKSNRIILAQETELRDLKTKLKLARGEIEQYQSRSNDTGFNPAERNEASMRLTVLVSRNATLEQENSALAEQVESLEAKLQRSSESENRTVLTKTEHTDVDQIKEKMKILFQQIEIEKAAQREAALLKELEDCRSERDGLMHQHKQAKSENKQLRKEVDESTSARSQAERLRTAGEAVRLQTAERQQALEQELQKQRLEKGELELQISKLERANMLLASREGEIADLKASLSAAARQFSSEKGETEALRARCVEAEKLAAAEHDAAIQACDALVLAEERVSAAMARVRELAADKDTWQAEIRTAEMLARDLEQTVTMLGACCSLQRTTELRCKSEVREAANALAAKEEELTRLRAHAESKGVDHENNLKTTAALRDDLEMKEDQLVKLKVAHERLIQRFETQQTSLRTSREAAAAEGHEMSAMRELVAKKERELVEARADGYRAAERLETVQASMKRREEEWDAEVKKLRETTERKSAEAVQLREVNRSNMESLKSIQESISKQDDRAAASKEEMAALKRLGESTEQELGKLRGEYETAEEKIRALEEEKEKREEEEEEGKSKTVLALQEALLKREKEMAAAEEEKAGMTGRIADMEGQTQLAELMREKVDKRDKEIKKLREEVQRGAERVLTLQEVVRQTEDLRVSEVASLHKMLQQRDEELVLAHREKEALQEQINRESTGAADRHQKPQDHRSVSGRLAMEWETAGWVVKQEEASVMTSPSSSNNVRSKPGAAKNESAQDQGQGDAEGQDETVSAKPMDDGPREILTQSSPGRAYRDTVMESIMYASNSVSKLRDLDAKAAALLEGMGHAASPDANSLQPVKQPQLGSPHEAESERGSLGSSAVSPLPLSPDVEIPLRPQGTAQEPAMFAGVGTVRLTSSLIVAGPDSTPYGASRSATSTPRDTPLWSPSPKHAMTARASVQTLAKGLEPVSNPRQMRGQRPDDPLSEESPALSLSRMPPSIQPPPRYSLSPPSPTRQHVAQHRPSPVDVGWRGVTHSTPPSPLSSAGSGLMSVQREGSSGSSPRHVKTTRSATSVPLNILPPTTGPAARQNVTDYNRLADTVAVPTLSSRAARSPSGADTGTMALPATTHGPESTQRERFKSEGSPAVATQPEALVQALGLVVAKGRAGLGGAEMVVVVQVLHGGPAGMGGQIMPGDVVLSVDGEWLAGLSLARAARRLQDVEGSVTLAMLRPVVDARPSTFQVQLAPQRAGSVISPSGWQSRAAAGSESPPGHRGVHHDVGVSDSDRGQPGTVLLLRDPPALGMIRSRAAGLYGLVVDSAAARAAKRA